MLVARRIDHADTRPHVNHGFDRNPGPPKIPDQAVGAVIVREHHGPPSRGNCVSVQVCAHRSCQQDARPVVVGEDEGPFVGACRQDDLSGSDLPESSAAGFALGDHDQVLVVVTVSCRPVKKPHLGHRAQGGNSLIQPTIAGRAEQPAAELRLLVHQDHPIAG